MKPIKPLYKVYRINEGELEELKAFLEDKEYLFRATRFQNIGFQIEGNGKNSEELVLSIHPKKNLDEIVGIIKESKNLLYVFIKTYDGRRLDRIFDVQ